MPTIKDAASEFLATKRVAVTGVSRKPENHGSNVVDKRLRERGYAPSLRMRGLGPTDSAYLST